MFIERSLIGLTVVNESSNSVLKIIDQWVIIFTKRLCSRTDLKRKTADLLPQANITCGSHSDDIGLSKDLIIFFHSFLFEIVCFFIKRFLPIGDHVMASLRSIPHPSAVHTPALFQGHIPHIVNLKKCVIRNNCTAPTLVANCF